jgi:cytochrome c oxidase cbb3-type subunit 3
MNRKFFNKRYVVAGAILGSLLSYAPVFAQGGPKPPSEASNPLAITLLVVIGGLLLAIGLLGNAVVAAMDIFREKMNKESGKTLMTIGIITLGTLMSSAVMAQDAADKAVTVASTSFNGLSETSFYLLVSVIGLELLVIICLLFMLRYLVGIKRKPKIKRTAPAAIPGKPRINWWEKLNDTKTLDAASEAEEDMGHDYDGIRELNNPTPPWWRWAFYFSIAFGVVYLWRHHVSHTAPMQLEELAIAETKAAAAKEAYLKTSADNVNENTVKLLVDANDLATGKKLFATNCAACHGAEGQGTVGPNLTDDYWLHGGKINDVFKTIKYGVPEKGMKSWQDDFSPKQIAQLASFIKSLHGSNPPNPKEKQGDEYKEE